MIKKLFVVCIVCYSALSFSQEGTASPYSFYGIGSLNFKGTVENRSMGGIGVYLDSIHFNLRNPASYVSKNVSSPPFNGESRPVKFSVAGTMTNFNLESNSGSQTASSTTFDYLAISFPVGKFGFGLGLIPYTSVGYRLETLEEVNGVDQLAARFRGEGGVNKVFAGMGYQISDNFNIGIDFNYNFGRIENTALVVQRTPEGDIVQYQTRENNQSDLSGLNFNFGLGYKGMITNKLELSATATFSPESDLSSENTRSFFTVLYDPINDNDVATVNTIDANLAAVGLEKTDLKLPYRASFGLGIGKPKSWFVGAEYTMQNTEVFSNPVFSNNGSSYENASQISVGGFYIPNYNAFSGYFKRVVYRAGFNFSNTGLIINNESINEFGISFGLGLPVGNRALFSNANLGFEYGQRGTTNQNLVQENFFNINLSLSFNSRWFQKRKYN